MLGWTVDSIVGDDVLSGMKIKSEKNGEIKELKLDGVFTAIGLAPQNDRFSNVAKIDERGYFDADESGVTGTKGLFVAGDCRSKKVRQISAACSDGAWAAIAACDYIDRG